MGELVDGDDGLPVENVGLWAKTKHNFLCRYIEMSQATRKKYVGPGKPGAVYIDPFCGPGRVLVRTSEYAEGSCVAAWNASVRGGVPFTKILIADLDEERLQYAEDRLKRLNAPVVAFRGSAKDTIMPMLRQADNYGLHFAFIDPYNLGSLDFSIFEQLSKFRRMDIMVHLSKMDLQRNLDRNIAQKLDAFDKFAPGWRDAISLEQAQKGIRTEIIDHWRSLLATLGTEASPDMHLLTGEKEQHLYWLTLVAKHVLAHKFWKTASNPEGQRNLF